MTSNPILLSTAYLPPVQYLSKFFSNRPVWIESHENFLKQTYRNRCTILTANGPESLVIPVEKGRSPGQTITDLRIAYDTAWQRTHWQAIVSAYNSSPFFEELEADFKPYFEKKFDFLFDFNSQLLETILGILEMKPALHLTTGFEAVPAPFDNLREAIHPKAQKATADPAFHPVRYTQVFDDKFGFVPNLSVIDVLFNCGSASYEVLMRSHR